MNQIFFNLDTTPTTSAICKPRVTKERSLDGHCIFVNVTFGGLSIVVIYKSPTFPKYRFRQMLQSMLSTTNNNALYVGDINLNLMDEQHQDIIEMFNEQGLTMQLNMEPSTNGGSHIDICFSDVEYLSSWFYESYYSYHKPICVVWPQFNHFSS